MLPKPPASYSSSIGLLLVQRSRSSSSSSSSAATTCTAFNNPTRTRVLQYRQHRPPHQQTFFSSRRHLSSICASPHTAHRGTTTMTTQANAVAAAAPAPAPSAPQQISMATSKSSETSSGSIGSGAAVVSAAVAPALYACSVSVPTSPGAVPDEGAGGGSGSSSSAKKKPDMKNKEHHLKNGKGFRNPWESWREMSGPAVGGQMLWRKVSGKMNNPDTTPPTVPVVKPTFLTSRAVAAAATTTAATGQEEQQGLQTKGTLRATWLGHACYHVEFPSGLRVLFDPVFEERCSPFSWLGPKRYTPPPCRMADIPIIDVVIISHSHYDHLSHPTVLEIQRLHPNVQWVVPLGLRSWFADIGIKNAVELDWWEDIDVSLSKVTGEKQVASAAGATTAPSDDAKAAAAAAAASNADNGNVVSNNKDNSNGIIGNSTADDSLAPSDTTITARISCLPCQHMSARTPFDRATTLWASWAVSSGGRSVWFGGDTGYRAVPELPSSSSSSSSSSSAAAAAVSKRAPAPPSSASPTSDGDDDLGDHGPQYASLPTCPAFRQIGALRGPFDLGLIPIGAYEPRHLMSSMHADPDDAVDIFRETRCARAVGIHWGTWVLTEEDVLEPGRRLRRALRRRGLPEVGVFDVCDIGESREF